MNANTLKGQKFCNHIFGFGMKEDGLFGEECKETILKLAQWACNEDYGARLDIDGVFGELTAKALSGHYVKIGESQSMVKAVQLMLLLKGYDPGEPDGVFGADTYNAVIALQKDYGIDADGVVGRDTLSILIGHEIPESGGSGEWQKYDPDNLPNFGADEFKCECGCGGDVKGETKCKMQLLRDKICEYYGMDVPINITSGFRCKEQNARDGGVPDSLHTVGEACDMYLGNIPMDADTINTIRELAHQCGMTTGNYYTKRFVHCQIEGSDFYGD